MIDKDSEPRSPMKDFGWLAIFLIVLGVIWFAQGGPSRLSSITSPFLNVPEISPSDPSLGGNQGNEGNNSPGSSLGQKSPYNGKIYLSTWSAKETDPQSEYIEIRSSSDKPVNISYWTIEGRNGSKFSLGRGANLFFLSEINSQDPIILEPNGTAIVITGRSPVGASFRLNLCTGYFNQFQKFVPYLSEECPRIPEKEIPQKFPDACFNFIRGLSACRMPVSAIPMEVGNDCTVFIGERANYNGCVTKYKNENNFYRNEWRIYLNRDKEIWENRDTIILRDQDGKIVAENTY
jgi:hypothetical protein